MTAVCEFKPTRRTNFNWWASRQRAAREYSPILPHLLVHVYQNVYSVKCIERRVYSMTCLPSSASAEGCRAFEFCPAYRASHPLSSATRPLWLPFGDASPRWGSRLPPHILRTCSGPTRYRIHGCEVQEELPRSPKTLPGHRFCREKKLQGPEEGSDTFCSVLVECVHRPPQFKRAARTLSRAPARDWGRASFPPAADPRVLPARTGEVQAANLHY